MNFTLLPAQSIIVTKFIEKYGYNFSWDLNEQEWSVVVEILEDRETDSLGVRESQIDILIVRLLKECKYWYSAEDFHGIKTLLKVVLACNSIGMVDKTNYYLVPVSEVFNGTDSLRDSLYNRHDK